MDEKILSRLKLLADEEQWKTLTGRLSHWQNTNEGVTNAFKENLTEEQNKTIIQRVSGLAVALGARAASNAAQKNKSIAAKMEALATAMAIMDGVQKHNGFEAVALAGFLLGFDLAYINAPIPDAVPEESEAQA